MSVELTHRFMYKDHPYIITVYHDGKKVTGYKMEREETHFLPAAPEFHFDVLIHHHTPYFPDRDMWNIDEFGSLVAEYEAWVESPDCSMHLEYSQPDMKVRLDVEMFGDEEGEPQRSYMLKCALAELIQAAAVDVWRNNPDDVEPEDFWGHMLMSVAVNYNNSLPKPHTDKSAYDLIKILAKQLRNTENLNTILD
jgi:hypothetical protein